MGWVVWGSKPGGRPALGPTQLPIKWVPVSFPGVKRPGLGVDHPLLSSAKVKDRVKLYLYFPSKPSWPVLGLPLPFTSNFINILGLSSRYVFCFHGLSYDVLMSFLSSDIILRRDHKIST
jgi:hypothetical protein